MAFQILRSLNPSTPISVENSMRYEAGKKRMFPDLYSIENREINVEFLILIISVMNDALDGSKDNSPFIDWNLSIQLDMVHFINFEKHLIKRTFSNKLIINWRINQNFRTRSFEDYLKEWKWVFKDQFSKIVCHCLAFH